jgi:hypothetical protein
MKRRFSKMPANLLVPFLAALLFCGTAKSEEDSAEREKPVVAHVKIFNACFRSGVELWETGLDLDFRNQRLATDVRVGRGGLVRTIEFTSKDTVDVRRHPTFLENKRQVPRTPAASLGTSFPKGSVTLLVVHGDLSSGGERIAIDAIREFPVPEELKRAGMSRFVVWNFRPGPPVFLAIGDMAPFELPYRASKEVYLNPSETEIFLIHKTADQVDFKRQLAVFKFVADKNYTGIISPAPEIPDRPILRISDSNEEWESITAPREAEPSEE